MNRLVFAVVADVAPDPTGSGSTGVIVASVVGGVAAVLIGLGIWRSRRRRHSTPDDPR